MAATVAVYYFGANASEPAGASAESGINFNREDTQTGTGTPIPIPTTTGTNYSWYKLLALMVTAGGGSTALSNRKVNLATSIATGLKVHFKQQTTYTQSSSGGMPGASGSDGAVPATYTEMTTSAQTYHSNSANATNSTRNGDFCQMLLGVSSTYAGGGGSASLPNITFTYDEA